MVPTPDHRARERQCWRHQIAFATAGLFGDSQARQQFWQLHLVHYSRVGRDLQQRARPVDLGLIRGLEVNRSQRVGRKRASVSLT